MKLSFIIPAYNEEENLGSLLVDILRLGVEEKWDYEIIIVDDNSSDDTGKMAVSYTKKYNNIVVVHRKDTNVGIGLALKEGTKMAKGEIIIWIMADRSDELKAVPLMVEKLNDGYDMVVASRETTNASLRNLNMIKVILGKFYSLFLRTIFKIPIHDITNAFRALKKDILEYVDLECKDFAISPELTIKAWLQGFKLGNVSTAYKNRQRGKSKFSIIKTALEDLKLIKYKFIPQKIKCYTKQKSRM